MVYSRVYCWVYYRRYMVNRIDWVRVGLFSGLAGNLMWLMYCVSKLVHAYF